jgi:hypothetical protein
VAYATTGTQQGGFADFDQNYLHHAALWSGTAASFVDLHPTGAYISYVYGMNGAHQVGSASFAASHYFDHAALWSGTAASFADLNPANAESSTLNGIAGNQEVGTATLLGGSPTHAGIWSGTAASFVDLNPAAATVSYGTATTGSAQAGNAYFDHFRAVLWFGNAANFLDLEAPLGTNYSTSSAQAIWSDGSVIQVAGYAQRSAGNPVPMLWTIRPVPEPGPLVLAGLFGTLSLVRRAIRGWPGPRR